MVKCSLGCFCVSWAQSYARLPSQPASQLVGAFGLDLAGGMRVDQFQACSQRLPRESWSCLFTINPLTKEDSVDLEEDGDSQDGWSLAPCEGMQPSFKHALGFKADKERNFGSVQPLSFGDGLMQKLAYHDQHSSISRVFSFPKVWYT